MFSRLRRSPENSLVRPVLLAFTAAALIAQTVPDRANCPNTPDGRPRLGAAGPGSGEMREITLTGAAACTSAPPGPERRSPMPNRWLIHFAGRGPVE